MSARTGKKRQRSRGLKTAGLFAGIGGLELGLHRAGHETTFLCELEEAAIRVLEERFPKVSDFQPDIRKVRALPSDIELIAAGFPCQDLSQAGATSGINGSESGLVMHVFRLLRRRRVPWLLMENVPFMLQLAKGEAMRVIVDQLEALGYRWAYRVIDTLAFGIPQRRHRVYLIASLEEDPSRLLFYGNEEPQPKKDHREKACGFFWTEGLRGLGWAVDAVPTLKGGSGLGIPSPPALWLPSGEIVTPDIRDAERLQGFEADWTAPALDVARAGARWKLVGNAVTVDVAEWLGRRLVAQPKEPSIIPLQMPDKGSMPKAGFGSPEGGRFAVDISTWPVRKTARPLLEFLEYPLKPLSAKATSGFLSRLDKSSLRRPDEFRDDLEKHLRVQRAASGEKKAAAAP